MITRKNTRKVEQEIKERANFSMNIYIRAVTNKIKYLSLKENSKAFRLMQFMYQTEFFYILQ